MIDSSIVRAHQHAAGGKRGPDHAIGRSRGELSTNIHAVVGELGLPLRIMLLPGQASDKNAVPALLEGLAPATTLIGDRGHDAQAVLRLVEEHGGHAHIPTHATARSSARSIPPSIAGAI